MSDPPSWYNAHVSEVSARYEHLVAENVHGWLVGLLPKAPALVLDVGAGTGRDAAWLASRGLEVVAVEPSQRMREEGQRLHASSAIRWIADSLPTLDRTLRLGLAFDAILLSAVWMHVAPADRPRVFRKLITLLKPGGLLAITLRFGPSDLEREFHPVSQEEIARLAREHGAFVERSTEGDDQLVRSELSWTQLAIRLPDDGTGALPLLRHIILNDDKASTYKLALLRALCRIADGVAGFSRDLDASHVSIPLGLVGLYWIRFFKPLLATNLPQHPTNLGDEKLGFVKDSFRRLSDVSHLDLRIGMGFGPERSAALHGAIRDSCDTIVRMPVYHMSYPNGGQILSARRAARVLRPAALSLTEEYLSGFGELIVPLHLWRAMQRYNAWIEPAVIAEWIRLMKLYADGQGRNLERDVVGQAMTWSEPTRDVRIVRDRALTLMSQSKLHCVWTGRELSAETLDVDHCFPWAAWPCDDLWNLLPAHRMVNQHQKRDRLPSSPLLRSAQDRIQSWWDTGYLQSCSAVLTNRFEVEARASLPALSTTDFRLDDVFEALNVQRLRLKHDQQVPEWAESFEE
jgi:SAM-dependent methyltransferase